MTQFLPPNLLALFAPRDPIQYLPPTDKLPHEKKLPPYGGVSQYLHLFEDPKETPPPTRVETRDERQERRRREKQEQVAYKLEQDIALWDPHSNQSCTTDPYKTLFIARVNYYSSEHKLRREFETYGPIKKICIVQNKVNGKQRGYAFIEYEHERDMHSAYKHADGKKIDGRRVLVDVERARTVKGWLPRRLGGGLGGTRRGGPDVNVKISGREDYRERGEERFEARDDREFDRRPDRERRSRSRDRDRERRRRSVSRGRDRRRDRERKSRRSSRDRDRDRGDRVEREPDQAVIKIEDEDKPAREERRRSRSRDRDRERKRRRSRSRSRDRKRRDRERDRKRGDDRPDKDKMVYDPDMQIKKEPVDDYPDYNSAVQPKNEKETDDSKENLRKSIPEIPNGNGAEYNDDS